MIDNEQFSAVEIDRRASIEPDIALQVATATKSRQDYTKAISRLAPSLPQLPDADAQATYEQIEEFERRLSPNLVECEYGDGGAESDDEIWSEVGERPVLLSADHATDPVRKATGLREGADHGTGGIVMALAARKSFSYVLPAGKQTGNANVNLQHPLKDILKTQLDKSDCFISVHGMTPGKFVHQFDPTEIHGVLGLGVAPTEVARDVAVKMIANAKERYGLKLIIGNDTPHFNMNDNSSKLRYDAEGNPQFAARLAAAGEGSTTNFVNRHHANLLFPALQIEISRTLRLLPKEKEYRETREKIMGVYMGYLLVKDLTELSI